MARYGHGHCRRWRGGLITTALRAALAWYILSRRSWCGPASHGCESLIRDILGVGVVGSVSTLLTTLAFALTTAMVGAAAGPGAVAGYGTARA